ncbi:UPF0389 protein CG9231-like [Tubulanus polymorphus]|uniref:UPF0389 protein CG9231-like n=1 Tax=Tubulanus polymorphus TaxID=672921 RepID=UPI003DA372D4
MLSISRLFRASRGLVQNSSRFCSGASTAAKQEVKKEYVTLSNFDKKVMAWSKIYKNLSDVPDKVSVAKMKRGRDWFRIRMSIGMIFITSVACIAMIFSGKTTHNHGHSVEEYNKEWHKKVKETGDVHTKPKVISLKE